MFMMKKKLVFIILILFFSYVNGAFAIYLGSEKDDIGVMGVSKFSLMQSGIEQSEISQVFSDLKEEIFSLQGVPIGGQLEEIVDEMLRIPPDELGLGEVQIKELSSATVYWWGSKHSATAPRMVQVNRVNRPISLIESYDRTIEGINFQSIKLRFSDEGITVTRERYIKTDEPAGEDAFGNPMVVVLFYEDIWFFPYGQNTEDPARSSHPDEPERLRTWK